MCVCVRIALIINSLRARETRELRRVLARERVTGASNFPQMDMHDDDDNDDDDVDDEEQ